MQFRGLRRQTRCAERPAAEKDKPTKGAGKRGLPGYWSARFFVIVGVLLCVVPVHAQDESAVLYPGTYQAEDAQITLPEEAKVIDAGIRQYEGLGAVEAAEFGKAVESNVATFTVSGTDVLVRWRGQGTFQVQAPDSEPQLVSSQPECGDSTLPCLRFSTKWLNTHLPLGVAARANSITLRSEYPEVPFEIDSITVLNRTFENVFPYIAAIGITLGMMLFVVASALRERWRR